MLKTTPNIIGRVLKLNEYILILDPIISWTVLMRMADGDL